MATEGPLYRDGAQCVAAANYFNPASALSGPGGSGQFLAVFISAARTVSLAIVATWVPPAGGFYGILQNTPPLGIAADVALPPSITKAVAGNTWTVGQQLMVLADGTGRLTPFVAGAHNWIVAQALEAAGAANAVVAVQLVGPTLGVS
jgi:hypothetical protein